MHVHADEDRHGEGHDLAALLGDLVAGGQLLAVVLGAGGVDGEDVPVEGSAPGQRHAGHEVDLVLPEAVHAAVGNPLEGGAGVVGDDRRQGDDLVGGSRPGRDGHAVAVAVRERAAGREAQAAGLEALGQQALHLGDLVGRGLAGGGVVLQDGAPQGAVADHGGDVDADVAVEAGQVVGGGTPVPVDADLEGGGRHALDLDHHGGEVGGVGLVADGGEGEAAVAHHDAGDAVEAGRGGVGVPEQLGVVVGVGVDEAGTDHLAGGVDGLGGVGARQVADGGDAALGDADVGAYPGGARAVDHRAARDEQVVHGGEATRRTPPSPDGASGFRGACRSSRRWVGRG